MPLLFIILILVFGAAEGLAQQTPEPTSGRVPASNVTRVELETGRPSAAERDPASRAKASATLTGLQTACVRPGVPFTLEGSNLEALERKRPALDVNGDLILLEILNRSNKRFVVRLPEEEDIHPDRTYSLLLVDIPTLRRVQDVALRVRVCPTIRTNLTSAGSDREVLIFAEQNQRLAVLQELRNRNIEVLEETDLESLGSFLIRVRSDSSELTIDELRAALPEAQIDLNGDLTANNGPRLYVKEKIGWQNTDRCTVEGLTTSIGIIDGEINLTHSAFKGQTIHSKSFLRGQVPDIQHATAIASILIGHSPELGLAGLLPGANIYSAIVLRQGSDNSQLASVRAIIEGLDWLLSKGLRLINISLTSDVQNSVLIAAIEKSLARGAIIFAAAGNQGPQAPPSYPAAIDGVITVTAIDAADRIYNMANHGDFIDFAAPGVDIWTASTEAGGAYVSGTSFAAPIALAIAALLQQKNSKIPRDVILRALSLQSRDLGISGKDRIFGNGLLQANC